MKRAHWYIVQRLPKVAGREKLRRSRRESETVKKQRPENTEAVQGSTGLSIGCLRISTSFEIKSENTSEKLAQKNVQGVKR